MANLSSTRRPTSGYGWDDLVLPPRPLAQLRELAAQLANRRLVLDEWGFRGKHRHGNGLAALFRGPSGTGKTMAAEVLARELGLDLWQISLPRVVSKYIGETEAGLRELFDRAETSAILLFDEADGLFGKRTEVKDAHDRYANVEVSWLLQRLEVFDGVTILATNVQSDLDDAFVRRLHFVVDFAPPDRELRERIWHRTFPRGAPLADDVDFRALADRWEVTGAQIRSIALRAAFLAAGESDSRIEMRHLVAAAAREFEKLGRPPSVDVLTSRDGTSGEK